MFAAPARRVMGIGPAEYRPGTSLASTGSRRSGARCLLFTLVTSRSTVKRLWSQPSELRSSCALRGVSCDRTNECDNGSDGRDDVVKMYFVPSSGMTLRAQRWECWTGVDLLALCLQQEYLHSVARSLMWSCVNTHTALSRI